ncbi:MAG: tripartite tricarboxylate transporter TctB family protein [Rhizobiales bacterium]|nr:tripartite tricarboxylate transporter TctB family protein [Hyphomicrobiales bacterium]
MNSALLARKDFWVGLFFVLFGLVTYWTALDYPTGSALRMGPGYFPRIVAGLLVPVGLIVLWGTWRTEGECIERIRPRPLLAVTLAVLVFVFVNRLGILVSATLVVVIAATGSPETRWREVAISVIVLNLFVYLVFVRGLGLQFPLFPRM